MNSPGWINSPNSQALLDESLDELGLIPRFVTNALLRSGIVTPRLLIMHTLELLQSVRDLGPTSLAYIEFVLGEQGWTLAEEADENSVILTRQLMVVMQKSTHPLSLSTLTQMVDGYWDEAEVAMIAANHPYIEDMEDGLYRFRLNSAKISASFYLDDTLAAFEIVTEQGKVLLSKLWDVWVGNLNQQQKETLFLFYGVQGGYPLNFQNVGEELGLTREQVGHIKNKGLQRLKDLVKGPYFEPMRQMLSKGIRQSNCLLTPSEWERWLDGNAVWKGNESRPSLLHLLCEVFNEFHYLDYYHVTTVAEIKSNHLSDLNYILKSILYPYKGVGLAENDLILETQRRLPDNFPGAVREPAFILKAISLFDRIRLEASGRYFYLRKKQESTYPSIDSGWAGTSRNRFFEWEQRLPYHVQTDFAIWLRSKWRDILAVSDSPDLFVRNLRHDGSLGHLPQHLQNFILDETTQDTAAALITNMAAAISLYVDDGVSIESISELLADTPIEQELWREIAQEFAQKKGDTSAPLHFTPPRVTWVWSLDEDELTLRIQNIILPAESKLAGEPDRLVWLETVMDDPLEAEIETEVAPWRMRTGERIVQDVFLREPDGPLNGLLVLLTDMDEVAASLDIPPYPKNDIQFFRSAQQGAFGIPVDAAQVGDGVWFVCAEQPLTFLDEDSEVVEPDTELSVPYPLSDRYHWAMQLTLRLPVTVRQGTKEILILTQGGSQSAVGQPILAGAELIAGLSRQVQPTFTNMQISLTIEYGGEQLLKQASVWMQGQDGWRWQRTLGELRLLGHVSLTDDRLHINLSQFLPLRPNVYAIQLRISLYPVFAVPLQFAVVPGLIIEPPSSDHLYTPANPPQLLLHGADESVVVDTEGVNVDMMPDGSQQITWTDLRHEPRLLLRFEKVDIPLAWTVPRFMVWLEPKPAKPFLTLDDLRQTTLHAVGTRVDVDTFTLSVSDQQGRPFVLRRGRYSTRIGESQLYDMVNLAQSQHTQINALVGSDSWPLFEVHRRPELPLARVDYDSQEQIVVFSTGLKDEWAGNGRFVVESLTNPFASIVELARVTRLQNIHLLPASLSEGVYLFRLELDGGWVPLDEDAVCFRVGKHFDDLVQAQQLINEIRNNQLISPHLAEDFVLLWAEKAELGEAALTPATLYQLATIPAATLEDFLPNHLERLWPPLAALKAVHKQSSWIEEYGLLPAWILLPTSIIFRTIDRGFPLSVYPLQAMQGGLRGKGYGRWSLSIDDNAPKEMVYVEWQPVSDARVHIEAGLPESAPRDWTAIDLLDTYGLYHCSRCGRLTGAQDGKLAEDVLKIHSHGRASSDLRDITLPENFGGYKLLAEYFPDRWGSLLMDIYATYGIVYPSAVSYLPEPPPPEDTFLVDATKSAQMIGMTREILRYGTNSEEASLWASASRLLSQWYEHKDVSELGQAAFALGMLLRTASYNPRRYRRLLRNANLSEMDAQNLLADLNRASVAHLHWGLTWAELLILHSPHKTRLENDE